MISTMSTGMHACCLRPLEDNWLYLAASSHYLFEEEVGLLVFFLESSKFLFSLRWIGCILLAFFFSS